MKSLKQFAFWSFLVGIALIVLSAMPGSDIPLLSEESQMPLVLGLILFVCGVSCYVVHSSVEDVEYQIHQNDSSIWREVNEFSDRIERTLDSRISGVYSDMREDVLDLRNEIRECKTSCCEVSNTAGSRLVQKSMNS